jgi:hypothetical protein
MGVRNDQPFIAGMLCAEIDLAYQHVYERTRFLSLPVQKEDTK